MSFLAGLKADLEALLAKLTGGPAEDAVVTAVEKEGEFLAGKEVEKFLPADLAKPVEAEVNAVIEAVAEAVDPNLAKPAPAEAPK
jgi:hypothetical protein